MRLVWLRSAERNLEEQIEYVAERDPRAAAVLVDRITAAVGRLAAHPRSGRPGRVAGTRELVVPGTPHIIVYRIDGEEVRIHRVLHASHRWPPRR